MRQTDVAQTDVAQTDVAQTDEGSSALAVADETPHPLDIATRLEAMTDGALRGTTSDAYWNLASPWGGTTVATMMRAVLEHPRRLGDPVAITVNYCAPIKRGDFLVRLRHAHSTRSTQHWSIEMTQEETRVVATATAVFGVRRETWSHGPATAPDVPPPETLERMPTAGRSAWLQHYDLRFVRGMPDPGARAPGEPGSALSHLWLADVPARPMDFVSLAALTDSFFLRVIHVRGFLAQMGTVTMSSYFHVDAGELATVGTEPVLGVADAKVFSKSFADQSAELWSRAGRLLATTNQMSYFRE